MKRWRSSGIRICTGSSAIPLNSDSDIPPAKHVLSKVEGAQRSQVTGQRLVIPSDRLCENPAHGSTGLTTNGCQTLQIKHLAVRPELRRRAPKRFSHSLALGMTAIARHLFHYGCLSFAESARRRSAYFFAAPLSPRASWKLAKACTMSRSLGWARCAFSSRAIAASTLPIECSATA